VAQELNIFTKNRSNGGKTVILNIIPPADYLWLQPGIP
jgi:hypothetical protein